MVCVKWHTQPSKLLLFDYHTLLATGAKVGPGTRRIERKPLLASFMSSMTLFSLPFCSRRFHAGIFLFEPGVRRSSSSAGRLHAGRTSTLNDQDGSRENNGGGKMTQRQHRRCCVSYILSFRLIAETVRLAGETVGGATLSWVAD